MIVYKPSSTQNVASAFAFVLIATLFLYNFFQVKEYTLLVVPITALLVYLYMGADHIFYKNYVYLKRHYLNYAEIDIMGIRSIAKVEEDVKTGSARCLITGKDGSTEKFISKNITKLAERLQSVNPHIEIQL